MSTKKHYFCNLCKDEIGDGSQGSLRRLGRGFKFGNGRLDWDTVQACENHLCDNCVDLLMATLGKAPPVAARASM